MDWYILLAIAVIAGVVVFFKGFFYLVFWNIVMNTEIIINNIRIYSEFFVKFYVSIFPAGAKMITYQDGSFICYNWFGEYLSRLDMGEYKDMWE
jgi:hypothetical protein